jgi:hypothetical protein
MKKLKLLNLAIITLFSITAAHGQHMEAESDADLAQELTNPVADLMTVPIQINFDNNLGPDDDGSKMWINIQPVIPFSLNDDWNIITRTIMPIISQNDILPDSGSQFGLGDINMSIFLAPEEPTAGGLIWGFGPILLLPTATENLLGGKKWGAGPSGLLVTMRGNWTIGCLANHVWSFAGDSDRSDISNTLVQPFVSYTWDSAWGVSFQTETTYNWETYDWTIPVNAAVSKLVFLGKIPVSLQGGVGYYLESPDAAAEGFRFRFQANFVLPSLFSSN